VGGWELARDLLFGQGQFLGQVGQISCPTQISQLGAVLPSLLQPYKHNQKRLRSANAVSIGNPRHLKAWQRTLLENSEATKNVKYAGCPEQRVPRAKRSETELARVSMSAHGQASLSPCHPFIRVSKITTCRGHPPTVGA